MDHDDKGWITANEMAGNNRRDQVSFRRALRKASFIKWHSPDERWKVTSGSLEHKDMLRVFREWSGT
jgi:hypothetical protein